MAKPPDAAQGDDDKERFTGKEGSQRSITERLIALGWQWNREGVLVQPDGFKGCKLGEDRTGIGTRYSLISKGSSIVSKNEAAQD